jgi:diguanylate cyclase (GGDEF)-like protein
MNISIRLHHTQNYHKALSAAVEEIRKACCAENCMLYTVDQTQQHCCLIDENGVQKEKLTIFAADMGRTPYEVAAAWEQDLVDSDCLMVDDLHVIEERDPVWYRSLCSYDVRNIILYAVRNNQKLVGFIWAANFDSDKMVQIKDTLDLTSFLIGAVISNHQFVSQLEIMSKTDALTKVLNRNAMNDRVDRIVSGEDKTPDALGIAYADLNGLKTVNDNQGHEAGDKMLTKAAALLRIAFEDYEIYRAGGDEFVIICPDIAEEALQRLVAQLRALADSTENVSFAIGTAFCTGSYDIRNAMHIADENMYHDKAEFYRQHPEKNRRKRSE